MDPNKNNQNPPVIPDDSSRTVHLSPPLPGGHTIPRGDFRRHFDEMKRAFEKHVREWLQEMSPFINLPPSRVLPYPNMQPQYRLQFINEVQNPSFTTNLVRDENGGPIKVAMYDTSTQSIISPDNFLSSAKVKIIVLNAEFVENKGETLSRDEFNQSVLRERERKGPILTGRSRIIQLENGVGTFENIVFNDNSSWTKSGFRLGVMVECHGEEGYLNGERVQEGVSKPFRVKDRRGKASQKPDQLELTHSVQCIKKIGKDRASFLQMKEINTVENFLWWYYNNKYELREILRIKSESSKEWESMIEHVMQCADEYKNTCIASNNSSQPRQALVHPMEGNSGCSVVGSGSSESNPSENDRIEGCMPAIYGRYGQHVFIPNDGGIPQSDLFGSLEDYSFLDSFLDNSTPNYSSGGGGSGNYGGCGSGNYGGI